MPMFKLKTVKNYLEIQFVVLIDLFIFTGPIDCECDPCHLNWLIRDNRQLLPAVYLATCANGTALQDLDSGGFDDCTVIIIKNNSGLHNSLMKMTLKNAEHLSTNYGTIDFRTSIYLDTRPVSTGRIVQPL